MTCYLVVIMELNHLRAFFEVAKSGRFTEAAKRLNISQSALSRSVALLEESEGVQLFERSKRGVTLTPIGADVFQYCEQLFQTVVRIESICRGTREICEGPLHFATTDHVINDLLVQPLQSFRREFPLVIPSVFTGTPDDIVASVLSESSEFGLSFAKVLTPQIQYEPLREEPMSLVVNADLWREHKMGTQAATLDRILARVGYISSIGSHTQTRASRVLMELFGKMPRVGFEANGQEPQKRICVARGGVAYLSRFMVEREIKSGVLHEIEVEHVHAFKLWLGVKKGHTLSLPAKVFIDRLKTEWSR